MAAYASTDQVDRDGLLEFVGERRHWILTTFRTDGLPQMSPVTGVVMADGTLAVATYPERDKVHNLRRDPRVSLCVLSDEFGGSWVQVDATCRVIDLPDAIDGLVEYYRSAAGEHPNWDEYRDAMDRQGKCLLSMNIERWGPVARGGFPNRLKMFEKWDNKAEKPDTGPAMFDD